MVPVMSNVGKKRARATSTSSPAAAYYKGRVAGDARSWVRVRHRDGVLDGLVRTGDGIYFIEPASRFSPTPSPWAMVMYRLSAAPAVALPVPAPSDAPASATPTPSAAPADSVAGVSSAAPPLPAASASAATASEDLPAMTAFTTSCKAPFVVLFTPPNPGWSYVEAAQNLKGTKELQDKLWFFELRQRKVTYFGAQAEDEATARALMAAYQAKVPKSKPILSCLDVKSYIPDRYQGKHDAEAVLINLSAGFVL